MSKIQSFTDLIAWQEGHSLVLRTYKITKTFPKEEMFVLGSQMRRCAISITSNTAEGFSRNSIKEKLQFYSISLGSLTELQNQLIIAKDLEYIDIINFNEVEQLIQYVHKLVNGLCKTAQSRYA